MCENIHTNIIFNNIDENNFKCEYMLLFEWYINLYPDTKINTNRRYKRIKNNENWFLNKSIILTEKKNLNISIEKFTYTIKTFECGESSYTEESTQVTPFLVISIQTTDSHNSYGNVSIKFNELYIDLLVCTWFFLELNRFLPRLFVFVSNLHY